VPVAALTGRSRRYQVSQPRAVAVYLSREFTEVSLALLGAALDGRDHSTVLALERRGRALVASSHSKNYKAILKRLNMS
jgi:chromosomal replication initiator protein